MTHFDKKKESELVNSAANGNDSAFSLIFLHYLPKIRSVAKNYSYGMADFEDIVQEGVIGLYKAVKGFQIDKGVPFSAFALLCVKRQMINATQKYSRHPEILSDFSSDSGFAGGQYQDLSSVSYLSPEDLVVGREGFERAKKFIKKRLSGFEYDVLRHYLAGSTYLEISNILGKPAKAIDNAISRIKSKLSKGFETP